VKGQKDVISSTWMSWYVRVEHCQKERAEPSGLTKALEKEEAKESWNMRFFRGSLQQCKGKGLRTDLLGLQ
jgi:hypothetical protein